MEELPMPHWWQWRKRRRVNEVIEAFNQEQAALEAHEPHYCFTINDYGDDGVIWNMWDHDALPAQIEGFLVPYAHGQERDMSMAMIEIRKLVKKRR